ncbi:MAG: cytochrome d ubiquinol oxidase subunit II [Rhodobacterales bacterium]|nr:cytochrome d ubiquinol oxidase subunit II [Rhodobacterales bacterium]
MGLPGDLALVWAFLIAFAVLAYVVLDGFDLGIGILFPFLGDERARDKAIRTIAPVWDGNETWLVFGGGGLMAAFPLAYATILPALYAPLTAMLLALVFRGVAFEFRELAGRRKPLWEGAFAAGSLAATLAQGIALGALVQGIHVSGRSYAGGWWDWLTPFSLLTGAALAVGYALLGAAWLVFKTGGPLRARARDLARRNAAAVLVLIGAVTVLTPLMDPAYLDRWLAWPAASFTLAVPILVVACALALWRGLSRGPDLLPFLAALGLFVLCYLGLGIGLFPFVVPFSLTIWQAAAPESSLAFLLVGAAVLVPILIAYSAHAYWVFRGKVDRAEGGSRGYE